MGDDTRLPGLRCHGRVLLPCRPRQSGRHGLQIPAVPPGSGCAASHPAGAVGLPGGHVPGALGETPPHRYAVRLCTRPAPLQPDGDSVALIEHLSDSYFHKHAQLEPLFLSFFDTLTLQCKGLWSCELVQEVDVFTAVFTSGYEQRKPNVWMQMLTCMPDA